MSALFALIAQSQFDDGHMGGGWGWLVIVAMVAMMGGMGWMMWSMMRRPKDDAARVPEDLIEILKRRYAAGELNNALGSYS